jgi:paraquat-inducible protein B
MASPSGNPVVIGGFAVGALVIGVVAVILFGSGRLFEKTVPWVAYFDHSVTGLDVGAPVIFRGVTVGSVQRIEAIVNPKDLSVFVPVYFETIPGNVTFQGGKTTLNRDVEGVERFISGGLRAQLKTQSFITGKLYLDLDLHPDTPLNYKKLDLSVNEMPTVPSEMQQVEQKVRQLFAKLSELPLEDLVKRLASAAKGIDTLVNKPELSDAIDELDATLKGTHELVAKVDARLDGLVDGAESTLADLRSALATAKSTLETVQAAIEPGSPLYYQLVSALEELEQTARSVRLLADELNRQPEELIFGKEADSK